MSRTANIFITALAPSVWGSTYIVTTELLPAGYPITVSLLRALPAGLLLLAMVRTLPEGKWWYRAFILGALNFSIFQWLLFVGAYRLPGGVAATVGAIQPLVVILLSRLLLGTSLNALAVGAAIAGILGVALLVLTPAASLDWIGVAAALAGALSMACGTVLARHWQPPVSPLTFTAWQLTAGGLLLLPAAFLFEPMLPPLTLANVLGLTYLGLVGGAITYLLWFRGIALLGPAAVAPLMLLSPVFAVVIGGLSLRKRSHHCRVSVLQSFWSACGLGSVHKRRAQQARRATALK